MEFFRRQYTRFLLLFMILLCLLSIGMTFEAIRNVGAFQAREVHQQIFAIKKQFLKDTVHNTIREIDLFRTLNRARSQSRILRIEKDLKGLYSLSPERFAGLALNWMKIEEYSQSLNIRFYDIGSKKEQYTTGADSYSVELQFGPYRLQAGVNETWVDSQTKTSIAEIIHAQRFENDGYQWVNEILDWEGGENYAIRRIHPNLTDTEGSLLSTKTTDIKGNTPYLTELEGVRESGELYSTYFFKRKGSEEVAEMLTYATLYKDYNWIIAMGMYLEDVQLYIDASRDAGRKVTFRITLISVSLMILFFVFAFFLLLRMEKWFLKKTSLALRKESNTDPLTGTFNRRMGEDYLNESFKRFHRGLDNPVFYAFDLDNFKKVNDTHGHAAGDLVLKAVVEQIQSNMRSTDHLFRWGGEEFLLLCYGVEKESAIVLAGKFNRAVASMPIIIGKSDAGPSCDYDALSCSLEPRDQEFPVGLSCIDEDGNSLVHVSISIGISWFEKADSGPEAALKRADEAMYRAKAEGKNCARIAGDPSSAQDS